jgi:hypothetical protein
MHVCTTAGESCGTGVGVDDWVLAVLTIVGDIEGLCHPLLWQHLPQVHQQSAAILSTQGAAAAAAASGGWCGACCMTA